MDQLTKIRFDKLANQTRCPACGSPREGSAGQNGRKTVSFACGATFTAAIGRSIEPAAICPASSLVAAEALNDEVQATVRSQAGAA